MTLEDMERITASLTKKSDKIRALDRAGVPRADIARFLDIRYQHVRNTLEGDKRTGYNPILESIEKDQHSNRGISEQIFNTADRDDDGNLVLELDFLNDVFGSEVSGLVTVTVRDGIFITTQGAALERLKSTLG